MTDLDKAIAELRRVTPENSPWEVGDFGAGSSPVDYHIVTILNAVLSGALIPATERDAAVAAALERVAANKEQLEIWAHEIIEALGFADLLKITSYDDSIEAHDTVGRELVEIIRSLITEPQSDALAAVRAEARRVKALETFYIDCEFDGHDGPLLSIAMVRGDGIGLHVSTGAVAADPWVIANVLPILDSHCAETSLHVRPKEVGRALRDFIGYCQRPTIIADSPVDIGRFCRAISTGEDGGWASTGYPGMTFQVHNVDCYPTTLEGAVQHNAWWDAMALRAALAEGTA